MIRPRQRLLARIEQLGALGALPEVLESLLDELESITHRLDELELHHWQPPKGYRVIQHDGATTWWTWRKSFTQQPRSNYSDNVCYHTRLECIRALKVYVEAQTNGQ